MTVYEVMYNDGSDYEPYVESYGLYSTREKAEELLKQFQKYDEHYSDNYYIVEQEVDKMNEWVTKQLEGLKKEYEEES